MIGRGIGAAAAIVGVDQVTKYLVLQHFGVAGCGDMKEQVTLFFDLVLTCNRGMSFGLFNSGAGLSVPLFTVGAAAIVALLLFWMSRMRSDILSNAVGLIVGGAVGNVIDRLRFGGVVDFLYFHLGSWYWPAFNVADSAICLGVLIMLLEGLLSRRLGLEAKQEGDRLP